MRNPALLLTPLKNIPLGARSVGLHRVAADWQDDLLDLGHIVFLWGIKGKGKLIIDGCKHILKADCIGVYMPGQLMEISAFLQSCYYFDDLLYSPFKKYKVPGKLLTR